MTDDLNVIKKIEEIEKQLCNLKLELKKEHRKTGPLEAGEEVMILNPNPGQAQEGTLHKVNNITRRMTVLTTSPKGRESKTVRSLGNVRRK